MKQICPVCSSEMNLMFRKTILHKYDVTYYQCQKCRFCCTESPYWLEEAYSESIAQLDIGLISRNIHFQLLMTNILSLLSKSENVHLDFAGGNGMFTRMMRDVGFNFYWSDKYTGNAFAKRFEYTEAEEKADIITAFEVVEHVTNPEEFLQEIKTINENATFVFSTVLVPDVLDPDWWYLTPESGQHISFYSNEALGILARMNGYYFYSFSGIYIFSRDKLPWLKLICLKIATKPLLRNIIFMFNKKRIKSLLPKDYDLLKKLA